MLFERTGKKLSFISCYVAISRISPLSSILQHTFAVNNLDPSRIQFLQHFILCVRLIHSRPFPFVRADWKFYINTCFWCSGQSLAHLYRRRATTKQLKRTSREHGHEAPRELLEGTPDLET